VNKYSVILVTLLVNFYFVSCHAQPTDLQTAPPPKREFRAVWIATVDNIDWPSSKRLSSEEQQEEFIELLNFYKKSGLNALFVQVRAAGDAFYAKSPEPWSEWLTGKQGKSPSPFYDPLEFMVKEAHQKGFEFHAWLNLNRLVHKSSTHISSENISNTKPEWVLNYDGYKLFNFGLPEVRTFITNLAVNLARNYDIDGIHFDDYFYPYAAAGQVLQDDATFKKYGSAFKNKNEWRRNNINILVKQIHDALYAVNPRLKFGISPFGVWRNQRQHPDGSETYGGLTSYDDLHADSRKWVQEGWVDYIAPQVYFSEGFSKVPFKNLVDWWAENCADRHLYVGHAAYRVGYKDIDKNWRNPMEIPNQIRYVRESNAEGSIFFSSRSMRGNSLGFVDSLRTDFYKYPALIPSMPWKDNVPPQAPLNLRATMAPDGLELFWEKPTMASDGDLPRYYVIYRFTPDQHPSPNDPRNIVGIVYEKEEFVDRNLANDQRYIYYVTAVDRLHNESRPIGPLKVIVNNRRIQQF
jgi:uncharacterized lipoprotein YddW (UPF0748 family)